MPEMSQFFIRDTVCPDVATVVGTLLSLGNIVLSVEGVQHLFLFILGLNLPKNLENLAVTRQSV